MGKKTLRWLAALIVLGTVSGTTLFAVEQVRRRSADKRLMDVFDQLKAEGFPLNQSDLLKLYPLDPAQNSFSLVQRLYPNRELKEDLDVLVRDFKKALLAKNLNEATALLNKGRDAIERAEKISHFASYRPECDWDDPTQSVDIKVELVKDSSYLLAYAAQTEALRGNFVQAASYLGESAKLSRQIRGSWLTIANLVELATRRVWVQAYFECLSAAKTPQDRALLKTQLDGIEFSQYFRHAFRGEIYFAITYSRNDHKIKEESFELTMTGPPVRDGMPVEAAERERLTELLSMRLEEWKAWPEGVTTTETVRKLSLISEKWQGKRGGRYRHIQETAVLAYDLANFEIQDQAFFTLARAATLLHSTQGAKSDLKLPHDPFDGKPIRWRQEGSRIVVWSVGKDGVDQGGLVERPAVGEKPDDIVFVLNK